MSKTKRKAGKEVRRGSVGYTVLNHHSVKLLKGQTRRVFGRNGFKH